MSDVAQLWQGDYGEREALLTATTEVNNATSNDSIVGLNAFVNNNPYLLEYFVSIFYDSEHPNYSSDLELVRTTFRAAGAVERSDVTMEDLAAAMAGRRYNSMSYLADIDTKIEELFLWPTKAQLASQGYIFGSLGRRSRVFLSHQAERKPEVRELQGRLAAFGIPTWFDALDIEYGQPLVQAIEEGISGSQVVVLWVSRRFLTSSWCMYESDAFIHQYAATRKVTLLPIVDPDVDHHELSPQLQRIRYMRLQQDATVSEIAVDLRAALVPLLERGDATTKGH